VKGEDDMTVSTTRTPADLLASQARIPANVVHRTFVAETVVLNLNTGKYHGLNPTGGHMLEVLNGSETVDAAATLLSEEYGQPIEQIREDICAFCAGLEERGLIELSVVSA
jgi:hypothetical protein